MFIRETAKKEAPIIIQVTAAIIRQKGKILICRRGAGGSCAFLWEFPGGKLEMGETLEQCIVRECREELDIAILVQDIFATTTDKTFTFTFFNAIPVSGWPKAKVHQEIRWVVPEELSLFRFCPADVEIAEKLKTYKSFKPSTSISDL